MLSRILVPVRGDGMAEYVLAHAARLAQRHKAHIAVVHCRIAPVGMQPYSTLLPKFVRDTIKTQSSELADQEEAGLRDELHRFAEAHGLQETETPDGSTASIAYVEEEGYLADVVKHNGRLADLIVAAKPDRDQNLGTNALKAALFETGRPVLMCPPTTEIPERLGSHVAVAWNGSLEIARTVGLTLDLARAADTLTILSGGAGEPHGATTEELLAYYRLRGINAEVHRFEAKKPGALLIEETKRVGADLLIMGAYGQSHEREVLFGGNTQAVVDKADIPVVMAH